MNMTETNQNGTAVSTKDSQFLHSLLAQANGEAAAHGPPGLSTTPTLSGLLQALRRRWLLAAAVAVLATTAAVFAVFQLFPPKYMSNIRLRVAAKQVGAEDVEFPIFKANMEWLVKSPLVLTNALNEKLPDGREIKDLDLVREKGLGAVDWLEKALKTDYLLGPEILRVTLPSDHPEDATELLNAIAKVFLNECAEMERAKKQHRLTDLRTIESHKEQHRRAMQTILKNQMEALGVKDAEAIKMDQERLNLEKIGITNARRNNEDEIAKLENELNALKAKIKNIESFQVPLYVLEESYRQDETLKSYYKQAFDIDLLIADYRGKYFEPYASMYSRPKELEKRRINLLRKHRETELLPDIQQRYRVRVREEFEHQLSLVNEKLVGHVNRRATLTKEMKELDNKINDFASSKPAAIQATEIKIKLALDDVEETAKKIREVELEALNTRVHWVERASPPTQRDASRSTKFAGAGGMGVFCLALFGVAFLEFRSRKISLPEEVSHGLGLNVVGTIPAMPVRSRKPSASSEAKELLWQNQLHESIDAIRTTLLHSARTESLRIVMVTSAECGEGKTTLATQLAVSLARAWKRTLIIDGDLRHPAAHKLFDVPQEPGLSEVLRGEVETADAVRATAFSRLWILPAGNGDSHAIQALAQESVAAIFETLKQQYDFIIVDSPPLLPVTDSLLLGQHVDGVLLSILRDVSRAPAVYAAQQKLAPLQVATLGAVVLGTQPEYGSSNYRYVMGAK